MITLFCALCIGHALCDYPLQGEFLSRGKNRFSPLPGVPWYWCLAAHAGLHGGAVWLITHNPWLGLCEFLAHGVIDDRKCAGELSFDFDQCCHILCKVLWICAIIFMVRW